MENNINKKEINKKIKTTKRQFKLLKFVFFAYIIVLVIWLAINNYIGNERSIYQKIGSREPYSISVKDALSIKNYAIIPYSNYLKSGDTLSAYNMLTEEYKKEVSHEDYIKSIKGIDFETFDMKEIKMKADGTYVATIVYERDKEQKETQYLLFLNEINPKIIKISPNKFIYSYKDLKFKENNVELTVNGCNIYTDTINLSVTIKNKAMFDTMSFRNVGVGYGEKLNKLENVEFTLKPGEAKEITVEYETNYFIPNNIVLKRLIDGDTIRTYTFYMDESK